MNSLIKKYIVISSVTLLTPLAVRAEYIDRESELLFWLIVGSLITARVVTYLLPVVNGILAYLCFRMAMKAPHGSWGRKAKQREIWILVLIHLFGLMMVFVGRQKGVNLPFLLLLGCIGQGLILAFFHFTKRHVTKNASPDTS